MSDLPTDLLEDILYRLPTKSLRSIRSTCKTWNALTKNQEFANALAARQQFLGFMLMNSRVSYLRFGKDLSDMSINHLPDDASPGWDVWALQLGSVSVKGNTYFFGQDSEDEYFQEEDDSEDEEVQEVEEKDKTKIEHFVYCFDFTEEKFGKLNLPIDFCHDNEIINLSTVREENLALLYNRISTTHTLEIWVTTEIESNAATWSRFFEVDMRPFDDFPAKFFAESFYVNEEEELAVIFGEDGSYSTNCYDTANIVGKDGYIESVDIGDAEHEYCRQLVCSSYVPSLVQLKINKPGTMNGKITNKKLKRSKRAIACKKCGPNSCSCGKKKAREASSSRANQMEG
ncbi:hypothetical protein AALP_AA3G154500 [Arabis alpina]|uniref:F-box domain-containing protein n=1 Tax=Arabis alpina TaxID=50452 RepID=A0A087H9D7_ARAAL|nr:hypothetical protein AALP_AA3G154500 [Arabis alpina]